MAMNNSNYGYQPTGFSSPYSSTPTGMRAQRPRFGYSGPSLYPRPRSSASKPNPDSFSDSMINNYGNSPRFNASFSSENGNSYNDSYNTSGSMYYSANESFYPSDPFRGNSVPIRGDSDIVRKDEIHDNGMMYHDNVMRNNTNIRADKSLSGGDKYSNTGILPDPTSQYGPPNYYHNNSYNTSNNAGEYKGSYMNNNTKDYKGSYMNNNTKDYKGPFQKNSASQFGVTTVNKNSPFAARKFGKAKRIMTTKQSAWRCDLCSLDFTSQIPYDMHFRGAKHAKKLKAKEALTAVQTQVVKDGVKGNAEKGYFCEKCNVKANSLLQLQTHLEGSKHKGKLQPKESKDGTKENTSETINANGSLTRSLPSEFGEPQPAKLAKFACDICSISVNSEIQLQQHLTSKKHQNKVEGKPIIKMKKNKMQENNDTVLETAVEVTKTDSEQTSNEASKMVVGVKTLASSFVQGGTLQ